MLAIEAPNMGPGYRISLDRLPLKRIHALEEVGTEILPPESTSEDKPLALLGRIDFGQLSAEKRESKKPKLDKEAATQSVPTWPWEEFVGHLQQAREELSVMLDLIKHVEENQAVTVASTYRPKPLPGRELCSEVALRLSSKVSYFQVRSQSSPQEAWLLYGGSTDSPTSLYKHFVMDAAKYLKKTAKALEEQVEREAVFYGALMRIQRNWKVKRQRGTSAGPGGSAGFSIDLSYPPSGDGWPSFSPRVAALCTTSIDQDSSGMLVAHPPHGQPINSLRVSLRSAISRSLQTGNFGPTTASSEMVEKSQRFTQEVDMKHDNERGVLEGVDKGARGAQSVFRRIQCAIFDEQVFDRVSREALLPSPVTNIVGISDTSLQLSLGHGATMVLELFEKNESQDAPDGDTDEQVGGMPAHENSDAMWQHLDHSSPQTHGRVESTGAGSSGTGFQICLNQVFHQTLVSKRAGEGATDVAPTKAQDAAKVRETGTTAASGATRDVGPELVPTVLRKMSAAMRHRVAFLEVSALLEKQVHGVSHLYLQCHPTWHPRVSAWDLSLYIPEASAEATTQGEDWGDKKNRGRLMFECTVVLRDEYLTVEGLEDMTPLDDIGKGAAREVTSTTRHSCSFTELPAFLLYQVCAQFVSWLHREVSEMGLHVSKDLLSISFVAETYGEVTLVACPDTRDQCVNWVLRTLGSLTGGAEARAHAGSQNQRYLGPLPAESLRSLIIQLISSDDHSVDQ